MKFGNYTQTPSFRPPLPGDGLGGSIGGAPPGYGDGDGDHKRGHDSVRPARAEDPLLGLKGSMAWQFAWQTAIAMAWSSERHKELLMKNPREFFLVYAHYDLPEGLDLTVKEMSRDEKCGRDPGWDDATSTWYLQDTKLTMFLPPAPPVEQQAVALAAYNATARTYPFTVC